jgi:hypothetical protein
MLFYSVDGNMGVTDPDLLPRIKIAENYGNLIKKYQREELTVKIYTPDLTELQRKKKDTEIQEKIKGILEKPSL